MHHRISDIMTKNPVTLPESTTVEETSRTMRKHDIGSVVVVNDSGKVCGIVTDRDVVIRALAEGRDPRTTHIGDICSKTVAFVGPEDNAERAIQIMRDKAVRRLPVMENDRVVGIVSLGDLAQDRDPKSVLGQVSSAPPNK